MKLRLNLLVNSSDGLRVAAVTSWLKVGVLAFSFIFPLPTMAQNSTANTEAADQQSELIPIAADDIMAVLPFSLSEPFRYDWNESHPLVKNGVIVVLRFNPLELRPRDAAERVLYAGDSTVQRLNLGDSSGYLIGLIPREIDLTREPIWLGTPFLPERVTIEVIKKERELAVRSGIKPFDRSKIESAGVGRATASDLSELLKTKIADLVLKYSPDEKHLAETWRLPEAK